jgi:hypothetical protein
MSVTIDEIIEIHRARQALIKAQTKLSLQAQALIRRAEGLGKDDNVSGVYAEAIEDAAHPYHMAVLPYALAQKPLEEQRAMYEKELVKLARTLPCYPWVKSIKGFGDLSFASIVGECGDIGSYKSVAALWKRMGLAVIGANRQGAPGKAATADDWIEHGYSKTRRSVMWNVGNSLILAMGKFRPMFGEDVEANDTYTYFQKVFATRARYEATRLPHKDGTPIKESATGKESYTLHAANRAKRYVEKRLLRELYSEWRKAAAPSPERATESSRTNNAASAPVEIHA